MHNLNLPSGKNYLVAQKLKYLPAMWEVWVPSLGREDPLEKEMATHSSILAWRISWTEEPGGLQSMGSQRVGHNSATKQQQQHVAVAVEAPRSSWILGVRCRQS